mmetsp:Transcript_9922/g.26957  ORF Transcript_9922/g.26957 Transcript_9922/m.26957 type:complete len:87 (+) Transcript_9922:518-778(+)
MIAQGWMRRHASGEDEHEVQRNRPPPGGPGAGVRDRHARAHARPPAAAEDRDQRHAGTPRRAALMTCASLCTPHAQAARVSRSSDS